MEEVFDKIFQSTDKEWEGFIDSQGTIYSGSVEGSIWETDREKVVEQILKAEDVKGEGEQYFEAEILNKEGYRRHPPDERTVRYFYSYCQYGR